MHDDTEKHEEWFLTLDEAGAVLRVTGATIRRLILQGELPGRKIGGSWRISSVEFGQYLGRIIEPGASPGDAPRMITPRYPRAVQSHAGDDLEVGA